MEFTEPVKCRKIMWVFVDTYPVYAVITCQSFFFRDLNFLYGYEISRV